MSYLIPTKWRPASSASLPDEVCKWIMILGDGTVIVLYEASA